MRVLLVALFVVLAGCSSAPGGDDPGKASPTTTGAPTGQTNTTPEPEPLVPVSIDVGLSGIYPVNIDYNPSSIEVRANNEVTIVFTNNDGNPVPGHNWVLEGVDGASTSVIQNGQTTEVTFAAPDPGTYAFYCSVGNHRDVGMEGAFVVTA